MSQLKVNAISDAAGANGNAITLATDGTCTAKVTNSLSHRNKIINGSMIVNQRGTRTAATSNGYYACDRMRTVLWDIGTYTVEGSTDSPDGFTKSLKWDCTTADTSVAAGAYIGFRYQFEGDEVQDLKYGTSDAETCTFSFWIKSVTTGNIAVRFKNSHSGGTRMIGKTVAVSQANTWEKKTVTLAGDTSTAIESGTAAELQLFIFFNAGTDRTSGAVPTSWEASTTADEAAGATLAINGDVANNVWLTGLQFEKGSYGSDFEHRSFGDELARCQRYYEKSYKYEHAPGTATDDGRRLRRVCASATNQTVFIEETFKVTKRASPTVTTYSSDGTSGKMFLCNYGSTSLHVNASVYGKCDVGFEVSGSGTANGAAVFWQAESEL